MTDDIGYQALTQAAMRGVMKEALKVAESPNGLPGDPHFYITFRTKARASNSPKLWCRNSPMK